MPQGSVLSPLLFLFVINTLRARIPTNVEVSMYADDVALWSSHPDKDVARMEIEGAVGEVLRWSREHNLNLNLSKCEVSFFSTDTKEAKWQPTVEVDGFHLKFNATPVFLGVKYDRMLTFRPQALEVAAKVVSGSRILGALCGREWGWQRRQLRTVYLAMLSSKLYYCSPGWQPWLAPSNMEILDKAQLLCLRRMTGMHMASPVEAVRLESDIPGCQTTMRRKAALAYEKSLRLPDSNPRLRLLRAGVPHRLKSRSSLRELAKAEIVSMGLGAVERRNFPPVTTAPWLWGNSGLAVKLHLKGGSNKSQPSEVLLADTIDTIRSLGQFDYMVFTDGSAEGGVYRGGSAAVIVTGTVDSFRVVDVRRERGAVYTSSFVEEVAALRLAVEWLVDHLGDQVGRYLVASDSQSVLSAVCNGSLNSHQTLGDLKLLLQKVKGEVVLQWVPGHCGLAGNERADQEARRAASTDPTGNAGPRAQVPVSYQAARCRIWSQVRDQVRHERSRLVYTCTPLSANVSRLADVTLARIRSAKSRHLATYLHDIGLRDSPICPKCGTEPETLEHWFQRCPATLTARIECFGVGGPPLDLLSRNPVAATLYLEKLRLL